MNNTAHELKSAIDGLQGALDSWQRGKYASQVLREINAARSHLNAAISKLEIHCGD